MTRRIAAARARAFLAAALLTTCLFASPGAAGASPGIEGSWHGTLSIQSLKLRVVFNIQRAEDGTLTATMDSPDQGARGIPVTNVTFENGRLRLEVAVAGGVYEGSADEEMSRIDGQWSQSGMNLPLVLDRGDAGPPPARPQTPKGPFPYETGDVSFRNRRANIRLAGTLTKPPGAGPFPAVLLISGSGPQDRDETIFDHKPFLVIADYLSRAGIAVLRVDDRGTGQSTGSFRGATTDDFADDAMAGVEYLRGRNDIDPRRVGLLGHSEGALIAPMLAARSKDIAFIVLLAAPGVRGDEILYEQSTRIARAQGAPDSLVEARRKEQERVFGILAREKDDAKAVDEILAGSDTPDDPAARRQAEGMASPWLRRFLEYDPAPTLSKVRYPVLALYGDKDVQVPPDQSRAPLERALRKAGNTDYTVRVFPGLNHLFQPAETGLVEEYGRIEETISPGVLDVIAKWIGEHTQ